MTAMDARAVMVGGAVGRLPARRLREAVVHVLRSERRDASVGITLLGPQQMRRLNAEYRQHDRPTDVLSFALQLPDGTLSGDIYICPYVAAREARSRGLAVRDEVIRLVVHGTLHILGYDHPEAEGRTDSAMWLRQERYLKGLR